MRANRFEVVHVLHCRHIYTLSTYTMVYIRASMSHGYTLYVTPTLIQKDGLPTPWTTHVILRFPVPTIILLCIASIGVHRLCFKLISGEWEKECKPTKI